MAADAAAGRLGIALWTGDATVDNALIMPAICYGRMGQAVVESTATGTAG